MNCLNEKPNLLREKVYENIACIPQTMRRNKHEFFQQEREHYQDEFRNDVDSPEKVKSILGRKWRKVLENDVYPFLYYLRANTPKETIIERPLSVTNKRLIDMIGSQYLVTVTRQTLEKLDCIKCTNNHFQKDKIAKIYIFNRRTIDFVYEFCKGLNFGKSWEKERNPNKPREIEISRCRFKDVRIETDGWEYPVLEKEITGGLFVNYPQLKHYMEKRHKLNEKLPEDVQGHFNPNVHYSKKGNFANKIGIRDYNDYCNLKKETSNDIGSLEHDPVFDSIITGNTTIYFERKAEELLKCKRLFQYDVKSSVPRVLYLLKKGEWLDTNTDLYKMINKSPFSFPISRDHCKNFVLKALFTTKKELLNMARDIFKHEGFRDGELDEMLQVVDSVKSDIDDLFGDIDGTSVFMHESCIYMDVEEVLQDNGLLPYIKKYDAFYLNGDDESKDTERKNMMDEIVKSCAEKYYKDWILPQHQITTQLYKGTKQWN